MSNVQTFFVLMQILKKKHVYISQNKVFIKAFLYIGAKIQALYWQNNCFVSDGNIIFITAYRTNKVQHTAESENGWGFSGSVFIFFKSFF